MVFFTSLVFVLSGLRVSQAAREDDVLSEVELAFWNFIGHNPTVIAPTLSQQLELESLGGEQKHLADGSRVDQLEILLRPTVEAMPKNVFGKLDHAAVRYATHRFFAHNNGWFLRGLEPKGTAWNASSPVEFLKQYVGSEVAAIFEGELTKRGFGLRETAVFAATAEQLISARARERLKLAYNLCGFPSDDTTMITGSQADKVLQTFASAHIMEQVLSNLTAETAKQLRLTIGEVYPAWPRTVAFLRKVRQRGQPRKFPPHFSFGMVHTLLWEVLASWGPEVNAVECGKMKSHLLKLDSEGTGCVRLSAFYGAMVNDGIWQFSESKDYLRQSGILDESDPNDPQVVVPNYLTAPGNCVPSMDTHMVCCPSECEELFASLERELMMPASSPEAIASLVFTSDYQGTGLGMRTVLLNRLDDVARIHGGQVPLHSRLFLQWMHHAFPRQCPFPHASGTTTPTSPWSLGVEIAFTEDEARRVIVSLGPTKAPVNPNGTCTPWDKNEELLLHPDIRAAEDAHHVLFGTYVTATMTSMACLCLLMMRLCKTHPNSGLRSARNTPVTKLLLMAPPADISTAEQPFHV